MMKPTYYRRFCIGLLLGLLLVAQDPTVSPSAQVIFRVPQDYPTIQAAIDAAPEGAIILIDGQYTESVTITKSVTLRGAAWQGIQMQGLIIGSGSSPVVRISSDKQIHVTLEHLTILQGESVETCIQINGDVRAVFSNVRILYRGARAGLEVGLEKTGSPYLTLQSSLIAGYGGPGLQAGSNAMVELIDSQTSGINEERNIGIVAFSSSKVYVRNSVISGHGGGILVFSLAHVILQDSVVVGNNVGITVENAFEKDKPAVVTLENSQVSGNRHTGIKVIGGFVELHDSLIAGNGVAPQCRQLPLNRLCSGSGILLWVQARLKLHSTEIRNNAMWGVTAYLSQCGSSEMYSFSGEVIFEGNNIIENNNRSGVLNGMGNPGNHPFKNLPDGQVCLP